MELDTATFENQEEFPEILTTVVSGVDAKEIRSCNHGICAI